MATTTKAVLSSSRSGSASSERHDNNAEQNNKSVESASTIGPNLLRNRLLKLDERSQAHFERPRSGTSNTEPAEAEVKMSTSTVTSVLASLNKMQFLRQRTLGSKGNVTKTIPLRKFNPTEVSEEMDRILSTALKGVKYDPKRSSILAKSLSESIKGKVKTMKFPRYKFVCLVTIVSQSNQCMTVGSRCLWNAGSDSYVTSRYSNDTLAAVATIYAVFRE